MNFSDLIVKRKMTRSFRPTGIDIEILESILSVGFKAPRAGNTDALDLLVLSSAGDVAQYWDLVLSNEKRSNFPWPNLLVAPTIIIVCTNPQAYVDRYRESDKKHTGLGTTFDTWQVPYWFVDAGQSVMLMQLQAQDLGLGTLFFGAFDQEDKIKDHYHIPQGFEIVGVLALGYGSDEDRKSTSLSRNHRSIDQKIHRGSWTPTDNFVSPSNDT